MAASSSSSFSSSKTNCRTTKFKSCCCWKIQAVAGWGASAQVANSQWGVQLLVNIIYYNYYYFVGGIYSVRMHAPNGTSVWMNEFMSAFCVSVFKLPRHAWPASRSVLRNNFLFILNYCNNYYYSYSIKIILIIILSSSINVFFNNTVHIIDLLIYLIYHWERF